MIKKLILTISFVLLSLATGCSTKKDNVLNEKNDYPFAVSDKVERKKV